MVKTKRTIVTDDDRYGGYVKRFERFEPQGLYGQESVTQYDDAKTYDYSDLVGQSFSIEPENVNQYAAVERVRPIPRLQAHTIQKSGKYHDTTIAATTEVADVGRIKRNAEFMPSVRAKQKQAVQRKSVVPNSSAKKALPLSLIIYITAVIILAIAVIASGLIMANVSNNASALEQRRNYLAEQLAGNQAELELTYNEDAIRESAEGLGMNQTTNTYSITLIPVVETQEYAPISNWFDRIVRFFTGQL